MEALKIDIANFANIITWILLINTICTKANQTNELIITFIIIDRKKFCLINISFYCQQVLNCNLEGQNLGNITGLNPTNQKHTEKIL
jgi:hypothetical protein